MKFKNKEKLKPTSVLPDEKQVVITLETQEEIDQLFAMLNYVPIYNALTNIRGKYLWEPLKTFLKPDNYVHWHNRLQERL